MRFHLRLWPLRLRRTFSFELDRQRRSLSITGLRRIGATFGSPAITAGTAGVMYGFPAIGQRLRGLALCGFHTIGYIATAAGYSLKDTGANLTLERSEKRGTVPRFLHMATKLKQTV